jgi:hypothetical protein
MVHEILNRLSYGALMSYIYHETHGLYEYIKRGFGLA